MDGIGYEANKIVVKIWLRVFTARPTKLNRKKMPKSNNHDKKQQFQSKFVPVNEQ